MQRKTMYTAPLWGFRVKVQAGDAYPICTIESDSPDIARYTVVGPVSKALRIRNLALGMPPKQAARLAALESVLINWK